MLHTADEPLTLAAERDCDGDGAPMDTDLKARPPDNHLGYAGKCPRQEDVL